MGTNSDKRNLPMTYFVVFASVTTCIVAILLFMMHRLFQLDLAHIYIGMMLVNGLVWSVVIRLSYAIEDRLAKAYAEISDFCVPTIERYSKERHDAAEVGKKSIQALVRVTTALHALRNGKSLSHGMVGGLQDQALCAVLTNLGERIAQDRERTTSQGSLADGFWNAVMLDRFFGEERATFAAALRDFAMHQNKRYTEVIFTLPPDVALYFTRMTLVDPAQQSTAPPPG